MAIHGYSYAVTDKQRNAIFGVGETADEAWADFLDNMNVNDLAEYEGDHWDDNSPLREHYEILAATDALRQEVDAKGGYILFNRTGAVLHLPEEEAA
jgi:hypothetical protein